VTTQYFRQEQQTLHLDNTVLEELQSAKITAKRQELHDLAGLLLFTGTRWRRRWGCCQAGAVAGGAGKMLLNPTNTI